jgi:hypothetical protein
VAHKWYDISPGDGVFAARFPSDDLGLPRFRAATQKIELISFVRDSDARGCMGALTTAVVPWFADRYDEGADWRAMAWWIHDHLPYSELRFFPKLAAFNIGWHERPKRRIDSFIRPRGCLTRPGMENHSGVHSHAYAIFPLPLR